jgi:hypothetical protein
LLAKSSRQAAQGATRPRWQAPNFIIRLPAPGLLRPPNCTLRGTDIRRCDCSTAVC